MRVAKSLQGADPQQTNLPQSHTAVKFRPNHNGLERKWQEKERKGKVKKGKEKKGKAHFLTVSRQVFDRVMTKQKHIF